MVVHNVTADGRVMHYFARIDGALICACGAVVPADTDLEEQAS